MKTKFETTLEEITQQLSLEHAGDTSEDLALKQTMYSILKSRGVESHGLVKELFDAVQAHIAATAGK